MPTLLYLDASPRGEFSISRQLSKAGVAAWKTKYPNGKVIERDLTKTQMTFVDLDWIMGAFSPPEQVTEQHQSALAISDTLIDELLEADDIIIGTPMYNFAVPAVLKAWIDHVVRAGKTFQYGASSSFKRVLEAVGLTQRRKRRRATEAGRLSSGAKAKAVNEIWTVDFKG